MPKTSRLAADQAILDYLYDGNHGVTEWVGVQEVCDAADGAGAAAEGG